MTGDTLFSLRDVTLLARGGGGAASGVARTILRGVTLDIPPGRYAMIGKEADRSALIDLLISRRHPVIGSIARQTRLSFPLGRIGAFTMPVKGVDLVRFFSRIYGLDAAAVVDELRIILPWPKVLATRLDRSAHTERNALSVALGAMLSVDTLLVDGILADPQFPPEFVAFLAERIAQHCSERNLLISSRQHAIVSALATRTLLIEDGTLSIVDGVLPPHVEAVRAKVGEAVEEEEDDLQDDLLM